MKWRYLGILHIQAQAATLEKHSCGETIPNHFPLPPPSLCLGHQPDWPGELGHRHPLGLRIPLRKETRQRGHSPAAEEPDQKPPPEDRHGQQDEEDGGVTAVRGERPKEQEGHREPGTGHSQCLLPLLTFFVANSVPGASSYASGRNSFCGLSVQVLKWPHFCHMGNMICFGGCICIECFMTKSCFLVLSSSCLPSWSSHILSLLEQNLYNKTTGRLGKHDSDIEDGFESSGLAVVQLLCCVWFFATSWPATCRLSCPSLSPGVCANSCPLNVLVMPSNYLILCHPLLFLPSIFPSIRVFSKELALCVRWPKSASVLPTSIQCWFPLGLTGLMSLLSKGLSRAFSSTTVQKHRFFGAQPSVVWCNTAIPVSAGLGEKHYFFGLFFSNRWDAKENAFFGLFPHSTSN